MAAKIWDGAQGAFVDAPTPQIYSSSMDVYKDSTGLIWDAQAGARKDVWGKTYLYNQGDECTAITGGWSSVGTSSNTVITKYDNYIEHYSGKLSGGTTYWCNYLMTVKKIAFTKDSCLCVAYSVLSATYYYEFSIYLKSVRAVSDSNFVSAFGVADTKFWKDDTASGVKIVSIPATSNATGYLGMNNRGSKFRLYAVWIE